MESILRLAYPFLWLAEAITSPGVTTVSGESNPITMAYSWAQLLALLTDRALWLFFLGIILGLAWFMDKRKEQKLLAKEKELRDLMQWQRDEIEKLAVIANDSTDCMDRVKNVLERIERKL
jgi:hypothetical protein